MACGQCRRRAAAQEPGGLDSSPAPARALPCGPRQAGRPWSLSACWVPGPDQGSDHSPDSELLTCKSGLKSSYQGFGEGEPGQKMGKALRSKSTTGDQRRRAQHTGRATLPLQASALRAPRGALPRGLVTSRTWPGSSRSRGYRTGEEGERTPCFPCNSRRDLSFRPRLFPLLNPSRPGESS